MAVTTRRGAGPSAVTLSPGYAVRRSELTWQVISEPGGALRALRCISVFRRLITSQRIPHPSRCSLPGAKSGGPIQVDDAPYLLELVQRHIDGNRGAPHKGH
jgi:hypothetical protein